jgi:superfamily II DNA or RNA helicase
MNTKDLSLPIKDQLAAVERRLSELDRERQTLLDRIQALRQELRALPPASTPTVESGAANAADSVKGISNLSPPEVKVALFRSLFQGRADVYARRWENRKTGKSGYAPVCQKEWLPGLCNKPSVKCGECPHRSFPPLTEDVVRNHLEGKLILGLYPLLPDETCRFLVADFDKDSWREDARALREICRRLGVPAALERSRSGNGGHVWIFFSGPVPAVLARKLGAYLVTETLESRPEIGLDSYDRFIPGQDTMPQGGFGSLIALPLQKKPRELGYSVFLDDQLEPYRDQWAFLASLERLSPERVNGIVDQAAMAGKIIGVPLLPEEESGGDPWRNRPARSQGTAVSGPFPKTLTITVSNQLYIPKEALSPSLKNRLIQLAAFQNPEFYKAQAMRLPTHDKPRIISCAESFAKYIGLPRGCRDEALELLTSCGIQVDFHEERNFGKPIDLRFQGTLRPEQQRAAEALLAQETGVLAATTAFGKTVVASYLIAQRAVNTLVVLHRQQLLDQWVARLCTFLNIQPEQIGRIGGGKYRPGGIVDVALIQSLVKENAVAEVVADYGQLIVDECHHISAFSFEQVARHCKARYVAGLSATVIRKDGRHPIIFMQCGPVRYRVDARKQAQRMPFDHRVIRRETGFQWPEPAQNPTIQDIYTALIGNERRNDMIFDDCLKALEAKRSPVLITERKEHLQYFAERLAKFAKNVVVLQGGMGVKQRQAAQERLAAIPADEERIILATGRYLGEGFDDARLDTLFLTMPISWQGTIAQYAGRLHREHDRKSEVLIYDYVDSEVPVLQKMWQKRIKGYQAIGYRMD